MSIQKKYGEAAKEYEESLKLDPLLVQAHNNLGIMYALLSKYDKAEKKFKEASKLDPLNGKAYLNLGNLYYYKQNNGLKAKHEYEEALKRDPSLESAQKNLAEINTARAKAEEAERKFEESLLSDTESEENLELVE